MAAATSQSDIQAEIDQLRRQLAFTTARDALFARIDDAIRNEADPEKITLTAATLLGEHLNINRCAYAEIQPDQDSFILRGNYTNGVRSIVGRYTLAQFSVACRDALRRGEPFVVEDAETDPRLDDVRESFRATEIRSVICVGLLKHGISTLAMAVHSKTPRVWLPEEIDLVTAVALRCWESVERSRILHQLHQEREALLAKTAETERQRAEIETIYRTAPIGLALFDLDGYHYLRLNDRQAAFFGLKPEQIVGRRLTEMAPIEGLKELFNQVALGEPVINFPLEGTLVTDPTDYRYWTVSYFPVYGADGTIQAITAASLEVTAQKKAELALLQSEKLAIVGRLASSIAHEINNPLESVTNLLYLAEHSDTVAQSRQYIKTAEVELRRASAITSQTLRFHKQATNPQEISLTELVGGVLSVYQGRVANANVQINFRSRATRRVRCFEGEIRQVLANLINNALDAMPAGGKLYVRSHDATNWNNGEKGASITIIDTGTGMTADTLERLFNPFFTTKGITGTGLGLWVSKGIITRHRGTLSVRSSQSPTHRGTVFSLFLPFNAVVR